MKHIAHHGVTPSEAEAAVADDPLDFSYEVVAGEERWTTVGHSSQMRILIVTWTFRQEKIRVVTARQATKRLRGDYLRAKGLQ